MREPIVSEVLSVNGRGIVGARCAIRECPVPNKKKKKDKKKIKPIAAEKLSVPRFCKDGSRIFGARFAIGECHVPKIYAFVSQLHQIGCLFLVFSRMARGFLALGLQLENALFQKKS